jgi:hypothetical protein
LKSETEADKQRHHEERMLELAIHVQLLVGLLSRASSSQNLVAFSKEELQITQSTRNTQSTRKYVSVVACLWCPVEIAV